MPQYITHIFFDLDGTLLNDAKQINEGTYSYLKSLKQRKHVQFGIATGRNYKSVARFIESYDRDHLFEHLILDNGVVIYDKRNNQFHESNMIQVDDIRSILQIYGNNELVTIAFHNQKQFCSNRLTPRVADIMKLNGVKQHLLVHEGSDFEPAARVMVLFDEANKHKITFHNVEHLKGFHPAEDIYEYLDRRVSKFEALKQTVEMQGLDVNAVMVFGDAENDLEMLQGSRWGVAMWNASSLIKKYANAVTPASNNEDGIAQYLAEQEYMFEDLEGE